MYPYNMLYKKDTLMNTSKIIIEIKLNFITKLNIVRLLSVFYQMTVIY